MLKDKTDSQSEKETNKILAGFFCTADGMTEIIVAQNQNGEDSIE